MKLWLRTLLVLVLPVGAFLGGWLGHRQSVRRELQELQTLQSRIVELQTEHTDIVEANMRLSENQQNLDALAEHLASAMEQQEIVSRLKKLGYHITYDYLSTPHSAPAPGVQRLVNAYGPDFVGRPFYIGCSGPVIKVDLLPLLPSLQNVDFDKSDIVDDDLRHMKAMPNLRVLFLNETTVSSAGLSHLVDTPIEVLHLKECPLDDSCVPYLSGMKSLKKLYIYKQISPDAIQQLKLALPDCDVE